ncbi:beta-galactosidase [Schumannella luteola]|uniref:Beta-galactosidase n=1 Tax=Schumannella luteola TaxID=472059 RepID=A0A852YGD6_9MICO|nr:beta-galactosidase family protein [Schumannella luteola]NYG98877.1 beta-galactosidase [Schumannella luteola]TPX01948.1 beta-galactosidase [Schumannella luteola]
MSRVEIGERDFLLDGRPHRILSGALHYWRIHPDRWRDRIRAARLLGLNTIETYIAWNQHSPEPGVWLDGGALDLARFLDEIAAEGMQAIVRPGPYICAELDGGGLPAWLFTDPEVGVRRHEPRFLAAVGDYLARSLAIVAPRQVDTGGPVVLVQVENEYGAYGDDADYLDELTRLTRAAGITVPLTTVDQPQPHMLEHGSRPGLHRTASFGSRSPERLATLREHQPTGPLMCMEYWDGWFDSWGQPHHTTSAEEAARDLDALLATGASVNLYMLHGGTNFGLTSGANDKGLFQPIATSYDYDAPLDEAGRPTAKYWAFREVLGRYTTLPDEVPPVAAEPATAVIPLTPSRSLLDAAASVPAVAATGSLPTMSQVTVDAAFLLHETSIRTAAASVLTVGEVRDRVHVIVDDVVVGVLARDHHQRALTVPPIRTRLQLLVENQGRVNYGPRIGEDKGVIGGAALGGEELLGWTTRVLDERALRELGGADGVGRAGGSDAPGRSGESDGSADPDAASAALRPLAGPSFAHGTVELEAAPADASRSDHFLDTSTLGKGIIWVNGFCLGRYWSRGPQRTLVVPGPLLRSGRNDILVLELDAAPAAQLRFVADVDLGWVDA